MKSTGIVRNIDHLGRIVIPIELRRNLGIEDKDPVEIFVDGEKIILRKYAPGCTFCDSVEDVSYIYGKPVCTTCATGVAKLGKRE